MILLMDSFLLPPSCPESEGEGHPPEFLSPFFTLITTNLRLKAGVALQSRQSGFTLKIFFFLFFNIIPHNYYTVLFKYFNVEESRGEAFETIYPPSLSQQKIISSIHLLCSWVQGHGPLEPIPNQLFFSSLILNLSGRTIFKQQLCNWIFFFYCEQKTKTKINRKGTVKKYVVIQMEVRIWPLTSAAPQIYKPLTWN